MSQKETFFKFGLFHVGNGEGTRFWEDCWLGDGTLASQYPGLYTIVNHKNGKHNQGERLKYLI
jgi:hypothetical protein